MSAVRSLEVWFYVVIGYFLLQAVQLQGRYTCHCAEGCGQNNINEHRCLSCVEGFYGPYCQKVTSNTQDSNTTGVTVTALAIVAGVSMALYIVLTGVLVWYIRHLKAKRDGSKWKVNHVNDEDYDNCRAQHIDTSNEDGSVTNTGEPPRQENQSTTSQSRDQNPQDGDNERGCVNAEHDIQMNEYETLDTSTDITSQNVYEKITGI